MRALQTVLCGLVLVSSLWTAGEAQAERRVALVIGNSSYANVRALANPTNDAGAVAALLKSIGFDLVNAHNDLSAGEMRRALREFSDKAHDADVALVYFAGHGIEVDGINYLLPTDAVLERDIDVEDEAVSLDRILKVLESAKRLRMVILDACRENPFVRTMRRTSASRSVGRGLARIEPPSSDTLVAFSAKAGSVALDGSGMHSPFTAALLQNIAVPGLDLRIAFGRVRDAVLKATANKQEPFVYGSLGGATTALVPPPLSAPAPAPAPAAVAAPAPAIDLNAAARRDYENAAQIGTREAWDAFLAAHGTGLYADLARAQQGKLAAKEIAAKEIAAKDAETGKAPALAGYAAPAEVATPSVVVAPEPVAPAAAAPTIVAAASPSAEPEPDPSETIRQMHAELKRLGCYPGAPAGVWSSASTRAVERFNKHSGEHLDVRVASLGALDVMRGRTTRVCPLECERGFRPEGGACVRIACRRGYAVGPSGSCEKQQQRERSVSRPEPRRAGAAASEPRPAKQKPAKSGGGGTTSVVCGVTGCQSVPKGCRGEVRPSGRDDVVGVVLCGR